MSRPPSSASQSKSKSRNGRRRGLHGEVVEQLGQMIVTGDALTDGPLAPDELAHRFDVSRTVVREALRSLESKGLITARPNVGTTVRPMNEWNLLDSDVIEWRTLGPHEGDQRSELRGLRQVIQTFAARLAADTQDPELWESLATDVADMDDAVRRNRTNLFAQADANFHQHLAQASGSLILNHLSTITAQGLNAYAEPATCADTGASVKRHWAVIDALRQGSDEAESAMRDLLAEFPDTAPAWKVPVPHQRT